MEIIGRRKDRGERGIGKGGEKGRLIGKGNKKMGEEEGENERGEGEEELVEEGKEEKSE